jgi:hypothetical protein
LNALDKRALSRGFRPNLAAAMRAEKRLRKRGLGPASQYVGRCKGNVVRRYLRAAHGSVKHAPNHVVGLIDRAALTVDDELIAVDAQGNRKSVLEGREILIELSEETEVIVELA